MTKMICAQAVNGYVGSLQVSHILAVTHSGNDDKRV